MATGKATEGMEPLLTARDVASWLKVSLQTVYAMTERGDLPCVPMGKKGRGRALRYRRASLERWVALREERA